MGRPHIPIISVAIVLAIGVSCDYVRVPDLTSSEAAGIISRAPEFNRYARLINVESLQHAKDSMDSVTFGKFTFKYLHAAVSAPPIEATVQFTYLGGYWYLTQFDYGCPGDCHFVDVYDGPEKRK